jgi:hypothetical protein
MLQARELKRKRGQAGNGKAHCVQTVNKGTTPKRSALGVNTLTLGQRIELIAEYEAAEGARGVKAALAKKYGVTNSRVTQIIKEKSRFQAALEAASPLYEIPKRKRLSTGKNHELEIKLIEWVRVQQRMFEGAKIPLTLAIIGAKAEALARSMGMVDFEAKRGWLRKFKDRFGLANVHSNDEAVNADEEEAPEGVIGAQLRRIEVAEATDVALVNSDRVGDVHGHHMQPYTDSLPEPSILQEMWDHLHAVEQFSVQYGSVHKNIAEIGLALVRVQHLLDDVKAETASRSGHQMATL